MVVGRGPKWGAECRKDTGEILGVHIFGLHAADLIHEASNAVATGQSVADIKFNVHAHPTLSEVRPPTPPPRTHTHARAPASLLLHHCTLV